MIRLPAIVVDTREPEEFVQKLSKMGMLVAEEGLPAGDFLVGKYLIERKEVQDFYNSYRDRSLQDQLRRLIKSSNGFSPVLLIEGNWNSVVGRMRKYAKKGFDWYKTKQAILTMYKKTILRHDVKHFHTQNFTETCELLKNLYINNVHDQKTLHAVRHASKKILTLDERARNILEGFENIGPITSDKILRQDRRLVETLYRLVKNSDEWDIPVGPKTREKIHEVLYHEYGSDSKSGT
jgi:ERCC4-type nuclease